MSDTKSLVDRIERALVKRLDKEAYRHSLGVSAMAQTMGTIYGVEPADCMLAGLLHDWDKCRTNKQLIKRAEKFDIELDDILRARPRLLHAQTAAAGVAKKFPEIEPRIIQAIANHTVGSVPMTDLDKIVYIADMIEPGRKFRKINDLREMVGTVDLDTLFRLCYQQSLRHLIEHEKVIHPNTFKVWNWILLGSNPEAAVDDDC